ncbi:helix-turn-helix transcriptional regulator [Nocardia panacis]|uniref:helix-turn-helix transcriptional regulator n=1 Tax=Nocardia panacis TaxID=2340916 RepID=UPI0019392F79|nr:helix-turn-helix transcriptional regulator [Nocardia panacis]
MRSSESLGPACELTADYDRSLRVLLVALIEEQPVRDVVADLLVSIARDTGDRELADRILSAVERFAVGAVGLPIPDTAVDRTCRAALSPTHRGLRATALSGREWEIARLVSAGMTNGQVATRLRISPHTVNFHLRRIFGKLSISTRVQLGYLIGDTDRAVVD